MPGVAAELPTNPSVLFPCEYEVSTPANTAKIDLKALASVFVGGYFEDEARSDVISIIQVPLRNCGAISCLEDFTKAIRSKTARAGACEQSVSALAAALFAQPRSRPLQGACYDNWVFREEASLLFGRIEIGVEHGC